VRTYIWYRPGHPHPPRWNGPGRAGPTQARQPVTRRVHGINVGGECRKAEIDGGYFGGYVKPANHVENRRDRRLRQYQSGKRKDVVVIREREARHCLACSPQKSLRLISSAPGSPGAPRSMLTKPGRGTSFMAGLRCTGWV
jgi:hypothetical protein